MSNKSFEYELPDGYREERHIDATDKKLGIILNVIAIAVFFAILLLAIVPLFINDSYRNTMDLDVVAVALVIFFFLMLVYAVLHELVHGAAYKILTHQKLTFGLKWSCAFCGVPHIYTYRRTMLISVSAPLIVFSAILLPLTVALFFMNSTLYLVCAMLFGSHLGGCAGDIYVILLMLFKYKDGRTLVRDTGPAQFFYVPNEQTPD